MKRRPLGKTIMVRVRSFGETWRFTAVREDVRRAICDHLADCDVMSDGEASVYRDKARPMVPDWHGEHARLELGHRVYIRMDPWILGALFGNNTESVFRRWGRS